MLPPSEATLSNLQRPPGGSSSGQASSSGSGSSSGISSSRGNVAAVMSINVGVGVMDARAQDLLERLKYDDALIGDFAAGTGHVPREYKGAFARARTIGVPGVLDVILVV